MTDGGSGFEEIQNMSEMSPKVKLYRIHGRIIINACVKYRKKIFIGVGDIHPEGQHFPIFCQIEQTKNGN